jgi:YfiH family protein
MFIRPSIFNNSYPAVVAAESTRHGGVSPAPYHSLNLGKSTEDATENVLQNRLLFCRALGFEPAQMAWSKQVHGDQVRLVTAPGGAEGFDALITNQPDILLGVSVADCTPILVYDAKQKAVAAIHAGWRGTAAQIVLKTLKRMGTEYGSVGSDC